MRHRAALAVVALVAGVATVGAGPASSDASTRARTPELGTLTFTVNTNADDDDGACQQPPNGDCTLREAINASNATSASKFANRIAFAIGKGVAVISENTSLPAVTRAVTIDGTSQPGPSTADCFTELHHPCIELRGPASNSGVFGLTLDTNATVEGLAVNGFTEGIYVDVHGGALVEDDYVGTAADGSLTGIHSGNFVGLRLRPTAVGNTIGQPGHGNLISNNSGAGVGMQPANNAQCYGTAHDVIQSNLIGTNAAGTAAVPNTATGITIFDMTNVTVGGTTAGTGNVISGNTNQGVSVFEGSVSGCGAVPSANVTIEGNLIGTNAAGTAAIPNGTASNQSLSPCGVQIDATGVTVGGSTSAARNVISGNDGPGILFGTNSASQFSGSSDTVEGNFIGTNVAGTAALANPTGILIENSSSANTIGGPLQGSPGGSAGNLLSGNGTGIRVLGGTASANLISGNFVGTNAAGNAALPNVDGIVISGAASTTVDQDVVAGNSQDGVLVTAGATSTTVTGSFVGTEVDGATALANASAGIRLDGAGSGTVIGGSASGAGNVLSGNGEAGLVVTGTSGAAVQGNMIGVDQAGTAAVPNTVSGVELVDASGNTIGGGNAGEGNVISGNGAGFTGGPGVEILAQSSDASNNVVEGNAIGTDPSGATAIPNATAGVMVQGGASNTIGGTAPGTGNLLSGNTGPGVDLRGAASGNLVEGNLIGTDAGGSSAVPNGDGVRIIEASTGNVVGGTTAGVANLISGNAGNGVILQDDGTTSNLVQGNLIGTDAAGDAALGNALNGVSLLASGNTIGGTTAGAGNVISGNGRGIDGANLTSGTIAGNFIGTTEDGTAALGNSDVGIRLDDSTGVTVGGSVLAARNVISGNGGNGLELNGGGQHVVRGNRIGTNAAGTAALPNAGNGVDIADSSGNRIGATTNPHNQISGNGVAGVFIHGQGSTGNKLVGNFIGTDAMGSTALGNAMAGVKILDASGNTVGGTTAAAGNRIEFNGGRGVVIDDPNHPATKNEIRHNRMFGNGALAIDLGADGPDTNDAGDADKGPNGHQNFPSVRSASTAGGRTTIHLALSSTASTTFVVEVFSNAACDRTGHGEGQAFVLAKKVTTGADGIVKVTLTHTPAVPVGRFLTATATDPSGNTSEFSPCRKVIAG